MFELFLFPFILLNLTSFYPKKFTWASLRAPTLPSAFDELSFRVVFLPKPVGDLNYPAGLFAPGLGGLTPATNAETAEKSRGHSGTPALQAFFYRRVLPAPRLTLYAATASRNLAPHCHNHQLHLLFLVCLIVATAGLYARWRTKQQSGSSISCSSFSSPPLLGAELASGCPARVWALNRCPVKPILDASM